MKTVSESMTDMTTEILNLKRKIEDLEFHLKLAENENKGLREQNRQLQQTLNEVLK